MIAEGAGRDAYRPGGGALWARLLAGFLASVAVASAMAWALHAAYRAGFYPILVAPALAASVVGGAWSLALRGSHCRNPGVAALGAAALGAGLYLGSYHLGLVRIVGPGNAGRVDLLPRYIAIRMRTDVARDPRFRAAGRGPARGPDAVQGAFNWFFFGAELLASTGIVLGLGRRAASRAYCESCGAWMASESLRLAPGSGAALWGALGRGDLDEARRALDRTSRAGSIGAEVAIEHCRSCPDRGRARVAYLTIRDVPTPGAPDPIAARVGSWLRPRPSAGLRAVADHAELFIEEVGALVGAFPGLSGTIEAHPDLFAEERAISRRIEGRPVGDEAPVRAGRLAVIEDVAAPAAGRILSRRNAVLQTILALFSALSGFVLAFGPTAILFLIWADPPGWVAGPALAWSFAAMGLNLAWNLFFARYPTARFMLGRARGEIEARPDRLVDPGDPDLYFVDIIPRANWGKVMMENASDIGFLKLDAARRQLVFEGDRRRYRIPADSILGVEHEFWAASSRHQLQSAPDLSHVVVVRARTADGPWETWFYRRQNRFRPHTKGRRLADALELERAIRDLIAPPR